jgi:hypothetical protein
MMSLFYYPDNEILTPRWPNPPPKSQWWLRWEFWLTIVVFILLMIFILWFFVLGR